MKIVRFACGWRKMGVLEDGRVGRWWRDDNDDAGAYDTERTVVVASVRLAVDVGTAGRAMALERQRVTGLADMVGCVDVVAQDVCFQVDLQVRRSQTRGLALLSE